MEERFITLTDGTDMGGMVIVFKTNAPIEELKELERVSNAVYINGGDMEDVPIWANVIIDKGYVFDYVDEHEHITVLGTSREWLKEEYPQITEHYCIDNQPELSENVKENAECNSNFEETTEEVNCIRKRRGR